MMTDMERARAALEAGGVSCALCRGGRVTSSEQTGIRPLIGGLTADPDALRGVAVADKIVGRAAALLFVYGGVRTVYAAVLSDGAAEVLAAHGVETTCGERAPYIRNRANTGPCPMEERVRGIDDPAAAFAALRDAVPM